MNHILTQILDEIKNIHGRLDQMDSRLDTIETQQKENTTMIKALLHSKEILHAQYDQILITTSQIEGRLEPMEKSISRLDNIEKTVEHLAGDISFLVRKSADHDDEIRQIRKTIEL